MFLVIIPIFLALCVLFAYLYTYVLFGVLNLSKRLSIRISFFIFYAIFTLLIAFARLDIVVISPYAIAIVILSILILKRKGYFTNFTKARVAMAGVCLLVFTWQLEVPQTIIVNLLPKKLEIVDTNFTYLENPKNFGRKDNIEFKYIEAKFFLNFAYTRNDIYVCDKVDCKGNKKYIGYVLSPWSERSMLGCLNFAVGHCIGIISKDDNTKKEILNYIKRRNNE